MRGMELYLICLVDSIVTRLQTRLSRVGLLSEERDLFFLLNIQTKSEAHPSSVGLKQLGCEADHSFPCSVEFNGWNCILMAPTSLHGVYWGNITVYSIVFNLPCSLQLPLLGETCDVKVFA